jgi:glycosyltransferase involved in cell wall biosynthesis
VSGDVTPAPLVTAIVPTLGDEARKGSLLRAIDSLRNAARWTRLQVVVVVNGNRHAGSVLAALAAMDLRVLRIVEASLPAALLAGRRAVEGEYFCFLDDDDEYLPGAIDARVAALARQPEAALLAANGYRCRAGHDTLALSHLRAAERDPLSALFHENWLPSCGGLFRSRLVEDVFFTEPHGYLEWTWLAFRMAVAGRRVAVLDEPTFRIHDTAASLSKTAMYTSSHVALYRRMLKEPLRDDIRRLVRQRLATALSMDSVARLQGNDLRAAWREHLEVLTMPGGWRYGRQTIRLIGASLRRAAGTSRART